MIIFSNAAIKRGVTFYYVFNLGQQQFNNLFKVKNENNHLPMVSIRTFRRRLHSPGASAYCRSAPMAG